MSSRPAFHGGSITMLQTEFDDLCAHCLRVVRETAHAMEGDATSDDGQSADPDAACRKAADLHLLCGNDHCAEPPFDHTCARCGATTRIVPPDLEVDEPECVFCPCGAQIAHPDPDYGPDMESDLCVCPGCGVEVLVSFGWDVNCLLMDQLGQSCPRCGHSGPWDGDSGRCVEDDGTHLKAIAGG
jgi:hypothetical protein